MSSIDNNQSTGHEQRKWHVTMATYVFFTLLSLLPLAAKYLYKIPHINYENSPVKPVCPVRLSVYCKYIIGKNGRPNFSHSFLSIFKKLGTDVCLGVYMCKTHFLTMGASVLPW